ncbi:alanine racemase [Chakrabartyella piscis]|uniref:alanine racemase n=1 Tax=Chakrabartyella piscis TaxID=2918914 RepID=UPI002958C208|nr:alanine racemase [Chakrabartyella piscis]
MEFIRRTWAEIDLDVLDQNLKSICSKVGDKKLMGIVKADAYGHGDLAVAKAMLANGYTCFGVSNIEEAIALRNGGIAEPILILGYTPIAATKYLAQFNLTQAVVNAEFAEALQEEAVKLGVTVDVHIKLDTGMTRVGFQTDDENFADSKESLLAMSKMKNLHITGIFTHFAVADAYSDTHKEFTTMQYDRIIKMIAELEAEGVNLGVHHCANSATIIAYGDRHLDMCRSGIISYGMLPSGECAGMIDIAPIMTWKSTIAMVKTAKAGSEISYGRTYKAETDRIIATIPIGYADGYSRALSGGKGKMVVNGVLVPVVGRVCMDQLMLDVTDVPNVKMGDEVIVMGTQGEVGFTADDMAAMLGTINYEITCDVAKRVPRIYMKDGIAVDMSNMIIGKQLV